MSPSDLFPEALKAAESEQFDRLVKEAYDAQMHFGTDSTVLMLASCMIAVHKRAEQAREGEDLAERLGVQ